MVDGTAVSLPCVVFGCRYAHHLSQFSNSKILYYTNYWPASFTGVIGLREGEVHYIQYHVLSSTRTYQFCTISNVLHVEVHTFMPAVPVLLRSLSSLDLGFVTFHPCVLCAGIRRKLL